MDSSSENKPFVLRLHERIAASRFLTFSLFLHLIIVVLAGGVVLIQRNSQPPDSAPEARILIPKTDEESVQTSTTTSIQQDPIVPPPATTNPLPWLALNASGRSTDAIAILKPAWRERAVEASHADGRHEAERRRGAIGAALA